MTILIQISYTIFVPRWAPRNGCYVFDNRTLTTKIATFTVNTYITISNLICKHMYNIFVLLKYVNILLEQKYQLHLLVADPQ